jgi:hypothetical protein
MPSDTVGWTSPDSDDLSRPLRWIAPASPGAPCTDPSSPATDDADTKQTGDEQSEKGRFCHRQVRIGRRFSKERNSDRAEAGIEICYIDEILVLQSAAVEGTAAVGP